MPKVNKHLKEFGSDALILTGTGIGLSAVSSFDDTGSVSNLSKGIAPIAGLVAIKPMVGIMGDLGKDLKKKMK